MAAGSQHSRRVVGRGRVALKGQNKKAQGERSDTLGNVAVAVSAGEQDSQCPVTKPTAEPGGFPRKRQMAAQTAARYLKDLGSS
jgi:hypothetical protein